jgi:hypothetical protein
MRQLHIEATHAGPRGPETESWDLSAPIWTSATPDLTAFLTKELTVTQQGLTTVSFYAVDQKGLQSPTETREIRIDRTPPVVETAASDASGPEASQLSASGNFSDADGDPLAITKVSGAGEVKDNGDGSWSWTYTSGDDDAGTVVVEASDGLNGTVVDSFDWRADTVAPAIRDLDVTTPAGPACQGATNAVALSFSVFDPAAEADDPITGSIDWGDGTGKAIAGRWISASHDYAAGVYSLTVTVADDDGGADQAGTAGNVAVQYAMSRILAPMNADGSSIWRFGATIPVKVRITDCAGMPVGDLEPTVASQLRSGDRPLGEVNEATSTSAADMGSTMRYDPFAGQYMFNFSTSRFEDGTATYFMYVREPHSLGSNAWGTPTPGLSSQKFGVK